MSKLLSGAILVSACLFGAAHAADTAKADSPALADYTRTGEYETCLTNHLIRSTRILNGHQILIEMVGGKAYLAEPEHCPGLSSDLTLVYDATSGRLCNTTIISLMELSSSVPRRGTCDIERFERLEKNPKPGE